MFPEMFSYTSQQTPLSCVHHFGPPSTSWLIRAAFHANAVHSSQAECSHHLGSQNTGNSHPRKSANHLRLRIGELHHVLRRKGHLQSIRCPKSWRNGSQELSEQQTSPGIRWSQLLPERWGPGVPPETEGLWQLASGYWCVYGHSHQLPEAMGGNWFWMGSLHEYQHPASTFVSENLLPICAPFKTV